MAVSSWNTFPSHWYKCKKVLSHQVIKLYLVVLSWVNIKPLDQKKNDYGKKITNERTRNHTDVLNRTRSQRLSAFMQNDPRLSDTLKVLQQMLQDF